MKIKELRKLIGWLVVCTKRCFKVLREDIELSLKSKLRVRIVQKGEVV